MSPRVIFGCVSVICAAVAAACGDDNGSSGDASTDALNDQTITDAGVDVSDASAFEGGVTMTEFALPDAGTIHYPVAIAMGADGNMWFTESNGHRVGRITPSGTVTEFAAVGGPQGIVAGSDNAMWFATQGAVGRIALDGGVTSFPATLEGGAPWNGYGIAEGPDSNLWLTSATTPAAIGRMSKSGAFTVFFVPDAGSTYHPQWISEGPNGLWYGVNADAAIVGSVTTGGAFTDWPLPPGGNSVQTIGVTLGPDGNVWYTRSNGHVGSLALDGGVAEYASPVGAPFVITAGPDGNVWYTNYASGKIGRCTPSGVITEFDPPTKSSTPLGIASGPGNTIWFTESGADKIGRITLN